MISHLTLIAYLRTGRRPLAVMVTLESAENGVEDMILEFRVNHSRPCSPEPTRGSLLLPDGHLGVEKT
jgi:hypothetical protein